MTAPRFTQRDVSDFITKAKLLADQLGAPHGVEHHRGEVPALIDEFLAIPGNENAGLLHVVIDDGNTATEHVEFCRDEASAAGDEAAFWLAQVLLVLTDAEREIAVIGEEDGEL